MIAWCNADIKGFVLAILALKMNLVVVAQHRLTTTKSKVLIEADLLKTTQEVDEEFNVTHSTVFRHLKKIRRFEVSSALLIRTTVLIYHIFLNHSDTITAEKYCQ